VYVASVRQAPATFLLFSRILFAVLFCLPAPFPPFYAVFMFEVIILSADFDARFSCDAFPAAFLSQESSH